MTVTVLDRHIEITPGIANGNLILAVDHGAEIVVWQSYVTMCDTIYVAGLRRLSSRR
ncbi:hypothetical protein [Candidatus Amarolinea dominans]|uniref:hypothetical protein n=1 Tax=Candidatus Amarolinea dominans TaxID=3140696 RepID=UPI001D78E3C6|nr:hypothetical protein [Anaerolineae bacterium]